MKIGDRCFVHGYVDEIRKDTVIVRNSGGYFGTAPGEVIVIVANNTDAAIEAKSGEVADEAYQRGYEAGFAEGRKQAEEQRQSDRELDYLRGCKDAWDAARAIQLNERDGGISLGKLSEMFGTCMTYSIFRNTPVKKVIAKVKAYKKEKEENDEIRVGDEVIAVLTDERGTAVVINIDNKNARYIYADGSTGWDDLSELEKTGRHFPEVEKLLEAMRK